MSSVRFPVQAKVRSQVGDSPPKDELEVGIFDAYGYWASFGRGGCAIPGDMLDLGNKIAAMLNAAYEQGRRDAKRDIREALRMRESDDNN